MLKVLGGILVSVGSTAIGLYTAARLRRRVRILAQLCSAIEWMREEIRDKTTPVPELFQKLAHDLDEPVSQLFAAALTGMKGLGHRTFGEIWQAAVQRTPELLLTEDEAATLLQLGHVLGQYGSLEQAASLESAKQRFDGFLQRAREERERRERVSVAFGISVGALLVILFW